MAWLWSRQSQVSNLCSASRMSTSTTTMNRPASWWECCLTRRATTANKHSGWLSATAHSHSSPIKLPTQSTTSGYCPGLVSSRHLITPLKNYTLSTSLTSRTGQSSTDLGEMSIEFSVAKTVIPSLTQLSPSTNSFRICTKNAKKIL